MYQLNGERAELYASMDAGDSTAFMRLASASSVVGAERYAILDTRLLAELEGPKVKSPRLRAFEWRLSAVEIKRMPAAA